jgi:hypothetical protein
MMGLFYGCIMFFAMVELMVLCLVFCDFVVSL